MDTPSSGHSHTSLDAVAEQFVFGSGEYVFDPEEHVPESECGFYPCEESVCNEHG
jgi:hypothetical protein